MTLHYDREREHDGERIWRDEFGTARVWRGAVAWYYLSPNDEVETVRRLCPVSYGDWEALILFRAFVRLSKVRGWGYALSRRARG